MLPLSARPAPLGLALCAAFGAALCALCSSCVERPAGAWSERLPSWDAPPIPDAGGADLGAPDLAPPDLAPPDLAPPDLALPDLAPPDLAPPDLAPPDDGPPPDPLVFRRRYAVELTWEINGPGGFGREVDLDLHVLHPSFQGLDVYLFEGSDLDCSYLNPGPDWGDPGPLHNPSLDRDELIGEGAEVTTIEEMESALVTGTGRGYTVAVFAFSMPEELTATARLRVFVDGELITQSSRELTRVNEAWVAGRFGLTAAGAPEFVWSEPPPSP